ncbi:MAG: tetratricopeptide repeat protein, partial [bacterium]
LKSAKKDFPKISSRKRYFDFIKEKGQECIHTLHPGKALAYAGSVAIILILSIYSLAFFSRSDNFYLAEIEPEKQSTLRTGVDSASILTQGMRLFNQENYAQAVKQFQLFLNENPENYPANYYAGLSFLLSAKKGLPGLSYTYDQTKVSAGIAYLNQALQNSENNKFYREDCYWYLGKAFLMKGKASEAREFFHRIIQLNHPYLIRKAAAKEMLAKLH